MQWVQTILSIIIALVLLSVDLILANWIASILTPLFDYFVVVEVILVGSAFGAIYVSFKLRQH